MSLDNASLIELLGLLPVSAQAEVLAQTPKTEQVVLSTDWRVWARPKQLPPAGDWLTWVVRAGRGWGKTRTGAGWVHERAREMRGRWIAMIAKTPADARDYMIEGPGGIMRNSAKQDRPTYEPSKRRLTWPNGSWATIYSSEDPDQLRGFSGDTAWIDEMAKYDNPGEVWRMLQFGMRELSNDQPRICITTTPRPLALLEEIEADESTVVVVGSSYENRSNLSEVWFNRILAAYEGTELGEQEIHARILDEVKGRVYSSFSKRPYPFGNIDESVKDYGAELLVGMDFNVNPMTAVVGVKAGDELHVLDALQVPTSNTEQMADKLNELYPNRRIIVCPDPSGSQRKTSAPVGVTDFTILERAGFVVDAPKKAPPVVDRINNAQAMFLQGTRRRIRIHPGCEALIRALGGLAYRENTSIPDHTSGYGHITDALGYLLWARFNVLMKANRPTLHIVRH